ncbi:14779_t:CDS:2, partial [Funneliformis mosseae]
KYDYYTQKEKKKIGNKATLNKNNLTVVTELGTMDIMAAVRQDRLNLLSGSSEGKIHARLYDLKPDSTCEFVPIISKDRVQFICESNSFRFIAYLGSVLEEHHSTSRWLGKILKLGDLQYATYFHFVEKSCEFEQSIKEAEKIMRMRK